MKKVYQYLLLAGLVVLAAACENEIAIDNGDEGSEQQMITETISANILGETKATVDANAKFAWTVGDNIAVHVSNGKYVFTSGTGGASEAAASASFTVSYPVETSRDFFAIFPSTIVDENAANYGQSEHSLDVTLPASYALDEVSGTATPCPMIATNTPGSGWTFSQLCGLLRLSVNSIPSDATGLIVQFPGKKVNGNFAIASPVTPGTSTIMTDTPASGEDQITVTFSAGITSATINLPLPTGVYEDVFITPVGSATKVAAVRHISAGSYTAQAAHGKKLTTTLVSFSVAADQKVVFAPGNLVATIKAVDDGIPSAATWAFHEHQYDRLFGTGGGTQSFTVNSEIEHFGWVGTSSTYLTGPVTKYGVSPYVVDRDVEKKYYYGYDDGPLMSDWGKNVIGNYPSDFWRTPTGGPDGNWKYLLRDRDGASSKTKWSTVCGIKGQIIAPDAYTGTIADSYDATSWDSMEDAGVVFLPNVGKRDGTTVNTIYSDDYGNGYYWSSTYSSKTYAYYLVVTSDHFNDVYGLQREVGMAIRLVRDL